MSALTTREALAKALGEHAPVYDYRSGHFTMECEACDFKIGGVDREDMKRRFGQHFADHLIASGAVVDAMTLADDEALVERVARAVLHRWPSDEPITSEDRAQIRVVLQTVAAALTERGA